MVSVSKIPLYCLSNKLFGFLNKNYLEDYKLLTADIGKKIITIFAD